MSEINTLPESALGLDVGTSRIVAAQRHDKDIQFGTQLNAFVTIPFSKLTQGVLKKEHVPHIVQDGEITVYGDESERFANLFHKETRRPMLRGILNPDESSSLTLVRQIVALLTNEEPGKGRRLCFSVPAPPLGSGEEVNEHEEDLKSMLSKLGYDAHSISEGLAVVYGELENSNYTGIGVSCGGGLCNVCLAYLSVPVFSFSIPKAGDFIDTMASQARGEPATRIRTIKEESFHFNGHFTNKIHQSLSNAYEDMIQALVAALKDQFASVQNMPKLNRPIPLVLSGGSAVPPGFRDRFEKSLREVELPVAISEVRLATNPMVSTARGALVAALSEL
ncbi:MAG TPA: hypothetical protein VK724_21490 [Bryobacteraceae bacterium]|jgi:hypothetical protein|nr:hypothetical protein [Bryobacteraceae bacterium]